MTNLTSLVIYFLTYLLAHTLLRLLQVFAAMTRDSSCTPDLAAWNALVAALSQAGRMREAKVTLDSAQLYAQQYNLPIPTAAFGAYIRGWKARREVQPAVAAFRHFLSIGGKPHVGMSNDLVQLCLRCGEPKLAVQIIRAAELSGLRLDREKYKLWFEEYRSSDPLPSTDDSSEPDKDDNTPLERFKWFLGLPNKYYGSEWR